MSKQTTPRFVSKARLVDRAGGRGGAVPLAQRFVLVWHFGLKKLLAPHKQPEHGTALTPIASILTPRQPER